MLLDHNASAALSGIPAPRSSSDPSARSAVPAARRSAADGARGYTLALVILESVAAAIAGAAVLLTRPGAIHLSSSLFWAAAGLVVVWPTLLMAVGAHAHRVLGTGSDEYRLVGRAGSLTLALAGFASYAAALDLSRALVVVAVPALTLTTLVLRVSARCHLHRQRAKGRYTRRVIVVGRGGAVVELTSRLRRETTAGLDVVAACVTFPDRARVADRLGVQVGGLDEVVDLALRLGAQTIAVTSASETAAQYLRELSWQLEGTGIELLVAPGLIEVAGPRLHIRPFEGLPLLAVEQPRFEGWRRLVKGAVDRGFAALAIVLLSPAMAVLALAVRLSSPGPALYRQERVGINGRTFTMFKFRSMGVNAAQRLAEIRAANISDGLLFKMREDPRVTPVGRWLRRLSLDELPQLFNILGGSMSLVGPRPPLPDEVAQYDSAVTRRLLVKPGLTGLWQISGRSDLPWEEAVRLDLRYVENWSLALDISILFKTFAAVIASRGAY